MKPKSETPLSAPTVGARQIKLLERLCTASGVSGNEDAVRAIVLEEVKPFAKDVQVDALGNVLVRVNGAGAAPRPRVMLAAHMDEVGFMLMDDGEEGIFRFELVGGIDLRSLPGKAVWVGSNQLPGVIGTRPIHLVKREELSRTIPLDALRIDIGPGGGKVKAGDWAVFATPFQRAGGSVMAKALDDRLGVASLLELVRHAPPNIDLLAAFTTQEEVGTRGARVAGYALQPDMAFVLDCTPANDLPMWDGEENTQYNTRLDAGPAIYLADAGTISDPRLVRLLVQAAEEEGIPYQFRQPGPGGTDAGAIHKTRAGVPSVSISVPGRYLHTAVSIVRVNDWKNTLALMYAALRRISAQTLSIIE